MNQGSIESFNSFREWLYDVVPGIARFGLILSYLTAGVLTAIFAAELIGQKFPYSVSVALGAGIGISGTALRFAVVFLSQVNPNRPGFNLIGEVAETGFTVAVIYEIYSLTTAIGLNLSLAFTFGVLMASGWLTTLLILREMKFAARWDLGQDPEQQQAYFRALSAMTNFEALEDEARKAMRQRGKFLNTEQFRKYFHGLSPAPALDMTEENAGKINLSEFSDGEVIVLIQANSLKESELSRADRERVSRIVKGAGVRLPESYFS